MIILFSIVYIFSVPIVSYEFMIENKCPSLKKEQYFILTYLPIICGSLIFFYLIFRGYREINTYSKHKRKLYSLLFLFATAISLALILPSSMIIDSCGK
jgi:hypothetical protein